MDTKISTAQYFKMMNDLMTTQQGKIAELQSQLSAGKKNVTPSTDVKATTSSLKLSDNNSDMLKHKLCSKIKASQTSLLESWLSCK